MRVFWQYDKINLNEALHSAMLQGIRLIDSIACSDTSQLSANASFPSCANVSNRLYVTGDCHSG